MQVQRNKLRNLGITPPTSASATLVDNTITSTSTTGSNVGTGNGTVSTTTGSATGTINLNTLAHLNATNFQITIPPATATFLYNDSTTKILQQPQIRALDGQKASLKIGQRVPVATGSFQPGIGGVGINPLVNTQFNYIDVGVNIDVTPHVHGTDQVTLKLTMDISAVDSYQNIGGIQQPVIGQRKIEHEIRMREGEANVMGGILEETESKSINGIPGLASIPFFKYFFSTENKQRQDNELVFMLIPHIVRAQDVFDSNTRAIDVGTANSISLHRTAPQPAEQQPAVSPVPQAGAPPADQAATAPAGSALVSFDPPSLNQAVGSTFTVNINMAGAQNVYSVPLQILYNPKVLQLLNVSNGPVLQQDGQAVALVHRDDSMMGILQVTASRPPGSNGITADGQLFTLTFQAKAPGQATLSINRATLKNASMQNIPAGGSQAIVTVH
jgi:general secretion pathway protein D